MEEGGGADGNGQKARDRGRLLAQRRVLYADLRDGKGGREHHHDGLRPGAGAAGTLFQRLFICAALRHRGDADEPFGGSFIRQCVSRFGYSREHGGH